MNDSTSKPPTRPKRLSPLFSWRSTISEADLTATQKHVALALSLYMNERGGSAFPGATRLANDCSLAAGTVRRALAALVDGGYLAIVQRGGLKGERRVANAYEARDPVATVTGNTNDRTPITELGVPLSQDSLTPITESPQDDIESDIEPRHELAPAALARKQTTLTPVQQAGEALIEACGWNRAEVTPNNLRAAMTAAADLLKLPDPPDADEIVRRGYNYRVNHPEWAITPYALVKWWADSAEIRRKPSDREVRNAMRRQEWQNIGKGR